MFQNFSSRSITFLVAISLVGAAILFIVGSNRTQISSAESARATLMPIPTRPSNAITPIVDFNPTTVSEFALLYTNARFPSLSGTPQIALARFIKKSELPLAGVDGEIGSVNESTQMIVIVLKGDFDIQMMAGDVFPDALHSRGAYICYLFQKGSDIPMFIAPYINGGALRTLLNDPTIPLDPTVVPYDNGTPYTGPNVGMPITPSPLTTPNPRYYAPPINTPTLSE